MSGRLVVLKQRVLMLNGGEALYRVLPKLIRCLLSLFLVLKVCGTLSEVS
ncbi:hypothetical protein SAMN05216222_5443 [Pseudomonas prosekii]|uniref:Uncharacterized protein n=1 Tax=Pseudomonas prosekii TaxID=1148509 RepID=A0A1H2BSH4_9PSED|nr:hypothetical protein SAMN05216222_5443 [Pseudomonas prosekii]